MTEYIDRIEPRDLGIPTYLENLKSNTYQIPTFQRDIVWKEENVKKLWDSIYKFYPLGSILIWKTEIKLQNHREIHGTLLPEKFSAGQYNYILDGQQRTASLFTSLFGGKIAGRGDFDPTLYIDLTIENENLTDDKSYKKRFLFWNEIDDQGGKQLANTGKTKRFKEGELVKLEDVRKNFNDVERRLQEKYSDYDHPYRQQLRRVKSVLDTYRVSFIELQGIQVAEVCQIFERINQAGEPLDIFDIVVAKTFRPSEIGDDGFYLRDLFKTFRNSIDGNYSKVDDLTMLQMLSVIVRKEFPDAGVSNITPRYLNELKAEHIEAIWEEGIRAIKCVFRFFDHDLHLKGPNLIPYRYFYMTLCSYFYKNDEPDYDLLEKYFWYNAFHNDDLLSNTTDLWNHIAFLDSQKGGKKLEFDTFVIDKNKLRSSKYSYSGRFPRAILALLANNNPLDWASPHRSVLSDVYYILTDKPNLHHIFPLNYVSQCGVSRFDADSLMNIAYLTQITNLEISDQSPLEYIKQYDGPGLDEVLNGHLVPLVILDWVRSDEFPEDAFNVFIEERISRIIDCLGEKLININFNVFDSLESEQLGSSI